MYKIFLIVTKLCKDAANNPSIQTIAKVLLLLCSSISICIHDYVPSNIISKIYSNIPTKNQ